MPSVVLCFHVHQRRPLRQYGFFDIGQSGDYFDDELNGKILERAAQNLYLPANAIVLDLIRRHRGRFRVSYSISGMFLEKLEKRRKDILESFQRLADTGCVEFLSGPSHHSLAWLFSEEEFRKQVALHRRKIRAYFGQTPRAFRNTELIYGNDVARIAESMGFGVILTQGTSRLTGCNATLLYRPMGGGRIKVLFRHDRHSDNIAFRHAGAEGQDVAADEFARRLSDDCRGEGIINLFMDYETFGEHNRNETGILGFLEAFSGVVLKQPDWRFLTPSAAALHHEPAGEIDMPDPVDQDDSGKVLSAWLGNHLQKDAVKTLYAMEERLRATKDRKLTRAWRNLQSSDHFYAMRTKDMSDGVIDHGFNPFPSPYDAYIRYMNILKDFSGRIAGKTGVRP